MYHAHVSIIQRSEGNNAVHTAAYYRGEKMYDERTDTYSDYRSKSEVVHSEIVASADAPEWVQKLIAAERLAGKGEKHIASEMLWNKVEKHAKRKDSQLGRSWDVALPLELTLEQNKELAKKIACMFGEYKTIVDFSVHYDKNNPHVHLMETDCILTEDGFGLKNRGLNNVSRLREVREQIAVLTNRELAKYGHDARIDHRSYAEQGVDLIATKHRGSADAMQKRGIETRKAGENEEIKEQNFQEIAARPGVILDKISQECSSFTMENVASEIIRHIPVADILAKNDPSLQAAANKDLDLVMKAVCRKNAVFDERAIAKELNLTEVKSEEFVRALEEIKISKKLMYLGVGDDGRDRYTTRELFDRETKMQEKIDAMSLRMSHFVPKSTQEAAIASCEKSQGFNFSSEQKTAISHMLSTGDVACLTGKAGTGKTTVLTPAVMAWKEEGFKTVGLAVANVAANALRQCGFDDTRSISSLLYCIDILDQNLIDKNTVVVVDEASMVGSEQMARLGDICDKAGAKFLPIGDGMQLSGVLGGAPFKAITDRVGSAVLSEVVRQESPWMREASQQLGIGNTKAGLQPYMENHRIHFAKTDIEAKSKLISDWSKEKTPLAEKIIIAHENEDIRLLNRAARESLTKNGVLDESFKLQMLKRQRNKILPISLDVAKGERVVIESRGEIPKSFASNNQFGTITEINSDKEKRITELSILIDGSDKPLSLDAKIIREKNLVLGYGYAATIHKTQGATKDSVFPYFSRMCDRMLSYVMMTRHKKDCHAYASREQFKDFDGLALRAGKAPTKDSVLDFAFNFAQRRGFEAEQLTGIKRVLVDKITNGTARVKDFFEKTINPEKYAAKIENQTRLEKAAIDNKQIQRAAKIKRENAEIVAQYRDLNQESGKAWAEVSKLAKELGHWSYINNRPELQHMKKMEIYKDAVVLANNANKIAAQITDNITKHQEILKDAGISEEVIKSKEQKHALTKDIQGYQQNNQERELYAYNIHKALEGDIKLYPQIKEANLDMRTLSDDAKEHQRKLHLSELSGKELASFQQIDAYNTKSKETSALYKEYKALVDEDKKALGSHLDNALGINRRNGLKDADIPYNYLRHDANKEIKAAQEIYNAKQGERNELAYDLQDVIPQDPTTYQLPLEFFQLENGQKIDELKEALSAANENNETKKIKGIQGQLRVLEPRQNQIDKHAAIHQCHLNVGDYQQKETPQKASIVRGMFLDDLYGVCFGMAKSRGVEWSKLLTEGEKHDRSKLTLAPEQTKFFDKVAEYLELDRKDFDRKQSYMDKAQSTCKKAIIAKEVLSNADKYKEALQFYQIACPGVKNENLLRHETRALGKLEKTAKNYNLFEKLIADFKAASTETEMLTINEKLNAKSLQFIKAGYKDIDGKSVTEIKVDSADRNNIPGAAEVKKYVESAANSRLRWGGLKTAGLDKDTSNKLKSLAMDSNYSRTDSAHALFVNKEEHKNMIKIADINPKTLEKHASLKKAPSTNLSNTAMDFNNTRGNHVWDMSESMSPHQLADWMIRHRELMEEGKKIAHMSSYIKKELKRDEKGMEKLNALNEIGPPKQGYSKDDQKRIGWAKGVASKVSPITESSPASQYLQGRGININSCSLSRDVRSGNSWNSELKKEIPSAVFVARNNKGDITATQTIFLEEIGSEGSKQWGKATNVKVKKQTLGAMKGSSCLIQRGTGDRIALCEGPETACSVAEANPELTVHVMLGSSNFEHFETLEKGKDIIICADNDGANHTSNKKIKEAAKNLSYKGNNIYIARPPGQQKSDFNDMATQGHSSDIRKCIDSAVFANEAVTIKKIKQTFQGVDTKPELREATGGKSKIHGLSAAEVFSEAFKTARQENSKWQHKYFTTFQANRVTQDVEFVRNQYNKEPSQLEFDVIISRAALEGKALEKWLSRVVINEGELTGNEMWKEISKTRDAAIMAGHRFTVLRDENLPPGEFNNVDYADKFLAGDLNQLESNARDASSTETLPDNEKNELIEEHTKRFVQRYGEEPNIENQLAIEKIAEKHHKILLFDWQKPDLGHMACVRAEMPDIERPKGSCEMDLAPLAIKDFVDIEAAKAKGISREELHNIGQTLNVENIIDRACAKQNNEQEQEVAVEKTKTQTRQLEM